MNNLTTDIEFITPEQISALYGFSKDETYTLLNQKGCPVLPRKRHAPYRIIKDEFEKWMRSQRKR